MAVVRSRLFVLQRLLAATMIANVVGCAGFSQPKVQSVVESRQLSLSGMHALHRGDWDDAEKLFTQAIAKSSTNQRARCCYAETLWRRGAAQEAIEQMQGAVELSAGDPNLRIRLGEMLLLQNQLAAAAEQARLAIRRSPNIARSWVLQGDVLARRGDNPAALASYYRALSYQPHYPEAQLAVAQLHRITEQPERALVALNALADAYRPDEIPADVYELRGLALKDMQRYDEASTALAKAVSLGRQHPDAMFQLGEAQMLAGDTHAARSTLTASLQAAPQHEPNLQLLRQINGYENVARAALNNSGDRR